MASGGATAEHPRVLAGGTRAARTREPRTRAAPTGAPVVALGYLLSALPLLVALRAWRGNSYWEYSDGVYALTARMLLDGSSLYTEVLAAQPPPLFYAGATVLAAGDSIEVLRAALIVPLGITGLLVALAVWRLTAQRAVAVGAGLASLVMPWTLHEQTLLMPETFAAPLLMGAAVLATTPRRAAWAGAAAALAASFKLAFLLPLAALALAARDRGRYAIGAAGALAALWAIFLATHGSALLENVVQAQWQTGPQAPRLLAGLWLQAVWNLGPLVGLAALAWAFRRRTGDRPLLVSLVALAAGSAALVLSLTKSGSYLNVLALAEPPLVALGAAGLWWAWLAWGGRSRALAESRPQGGRGLAAAVAVLLVGLLAAQSLSLVLHPARPAAFARPLSEATHGWALSGPGVERSARRSERRAFTARPELNPYIAFVARRPIPGGQPDRFILQHAPVHAEARRAAAVRLRTAAATRPHQRSAAPRPRRFVAGR